MAGAITHLLVAEAAATHAKDSIPELFPYLEKAMPFLLLGSVSPDLPYSKLLGGQKIWADRMHYVHTNMIGVEGALYLGETNALAARWGPAQIAWLAGYVAHCVTDATVHPIVQAIVGPYHADPERHRICEMIQDSVVFFNTKGNSLRGRHFVDALRDCLKPDREGFDAVVGLWLAMLRQGYAGAQPVPNLEEWYEAYLRLVGMASDSEIIETLSRPFDKARYYLYATKEDLLGQRGTEAYVFVDHVPVPSAQRQFDDFMKIGFQMAIENILPIWAALIHDVKNTNAIKNHEVAAKLPAILLNWDLDTGVNMDIPDPRVTYWPSIPPEETPS
jgi:hypothetical protein